MIRHRLATTCLLLCFVAPLAANAGGRCTQQGESEFCLGATVVPSGREARSGGWAHWAAGSRIRLGTSPGALESAEPDGNSMYVDRIPLDLAAQGARLYPRGSYGAGLLVPDPAAEAIYGSYPLSESFSLDVTAGKGRIGLRAVAPISAAGLGTGVGLTSGAGFDRTAWSVALNASRQIGAFGIGGRIGYVDVRDQSDALFDTGSSALTLGGERPVSLRKSFLGFDASYEIGRNWQLHGGAIYRRDEGRSSASLLTGFGTLQSADRDEKEWGIGVRYYGWRNFKLNVEFLKTSGREQFGNESLLFMGRFDF